MTTTERLRELERAATAGPWETDTYMPNSISEVSIQIISSDGRQLFDSGNSDTRSVDYDGDEHGTTYFDIGSRPNFDLVVAQRNALPAMLAVIEAAEKLQEATKPFRPYTSGFPTEIEIQGYIRAEAAFDTALAAFREVRV